MITGMVNAHREATSPLSVPDANGQRHAIDAVIDTGYTGCLTLPLCADCCAWSHMAWVRVGRARRR